MTTGVVVLGSTGSIGVNTLDVIARHPDRYHVAALTANRRVRQLADQCLRFRPRLAVMADRESAAALRVFLRSKGLPTEVLEGDEALSDVAAMADAPYVMAAIVGAAGLAPTLAAVRAGKRLLLANKEALVISGRLFMEEVQRNGAELLPIDSEHNAVFQCMPGNFSKGLEAVGVRRILLTASGGPFRDTPLGDLANVTPEQACAHPNWRMGQKISVDSATMMNKGLEVIEACWLFQASADQVEVVLHPQSVVHSLVDYVDGSVLAQMGNPDMRTPIAHALAWPSRLESGVASLDLKSIGRLDFRDPSPARFPCLSLAYQALREGGSGPAILNAANEVAVSSFLQGQIRFTDIAAVIDYTMNQVSAGSAGALNEIMESDRRARAVARGRIDSLVRAG